MSLAPATGVPSQFEAGNTLIFTESLPAFPASVWTLAFVLNRPGSSPVTVTATASGFDFLVTLAASDTAAIAPGVWGFAEYLTAGSERSTGNTGTITVLPNMAAALALSPAAQMLAALNAAILKLTAGTERSVNFNGQQFEKKDLGELLKSRTLLQAEVYRENARDAALRGDGPSGRLGIQFVSPYNQYPPYAPGV